MVLSATQAIPADAPLLLSYFEGGNDEFLLHYGAHCLSKFLAWRLPIRHHVLSHDDVVCDGQAATLATGSCCW
jgi:hypothetical protein